jgi:transcription elongation factor Elf1
MELTCIKCGQSDSVIRLDLDDGHTLTCTGCEESYSVDDVRACMAGWTRALAWIDTHPSRLFEPVAAAN